ncbi:unnamed protein product [Medioppia subpectinata]|uniref:Anaphase-promoting complex subunit 7 n=1 Tax=Medioppia subpectinata TaxID=1979941 RepID=A0A7R9LCU5_9ACAR|nr:unnamed protein product [Medioppia subpectinata]CAG2117228.1 unnamed protein product [Medioppia subpectinata]
MALGEIYRLNGNPSAVHCFKEVLKESPFALTAIHHLIRLDVKVTDILNIVNPAIASTPAMAWLSTWIRAQSALQSIQVSNAIALLRQLYDSTQLKGNVEIITSLAEAYYYSGDYKKAIQYFKKAFTADPMLIRGLDCYASVLAKENQLKELENLSNQLVQRADSLESVAEPWVVLSYYCFLSNKKESKSYFFAQKACTLSNNSVEALLLKGTILSESKRSEAKTCFLEAHSNAPHRFEPIKCLTEVYLAESQKQLAANMANVALKTLGHSPRTLTLVATVFLTDSVNNEKSKAKQALERAVKQDPTYLNAVYLLSNLYLEDKSYDKAVEILNKAIENSESNVKLHKILSECYTGRNEHEKASHHRSIVSKLELSYRNSSEGSQRLEHQSHIAGDNVSSTLDLEVDDIPPSDEDVDESETDVVWSDDNYSVT